tara:strand:+ start:471 stop:635 length:165 start_codon:yes stop_codon:yes gene_type:complete
MLVVEVVQDKSTLELVELVVVEQEKVVMVMELLVQQTQVVEVVVHKQQLELVAL